MNGRESCYHCGERIPAGTELAVKVDGQDKPVCCHGCLAVCSTIIGAGLQSYYRLREGLSDTPGRSPEDFSMYDLPDLVQTFSVQQGEYWESHLSIGGMHCAACAWLVEQALEQLPGVESAAVNYQRGTASVRWQQPATMPSVIFQRVHALGYSVAPYSTSASEQQLQRELDGMLGRLGVAGIGMMQVGMVAVGLYAGGYSGIDVETRDLLRYFSLLVATPVLLYSAQPFFRGALRGIRGGAPGIDVPVSLALLAAYLASVYGTVYGLEHVYFDTVSMFTFFLLLGRYLLLLAQRRQLSGGTLLPVTARMLCAQGVHGDAIAPAEEAPRTGEAVQRCEWRATHSLVPGDRVIVHPGETIPVDGKVLQGSSSIDESAASGEFRPREVSPGAGVIAGTNNIDGTLQLEVTAAPGAFRLRHIDQLLMQASQARPRLAMFADRIASRFVLLVLAVAAASFLVRYAQDAQSAFVTALAVLVVSCPCALSLATPATFTAAINGLRRCGIVVANATALERLPLVTHAIFDKTGTLTVGKPCIRGIEIFEGEYTEAQLLAMASALEQQSAHPIAHAFTQVAPASGLGDIDICVGGGVSGKFEGAVWRLGSHEFCGNGQMPLQYTGKENANPGSDSALDMQVFMARDDQLLASFSLVDAIRPDAQAMVRALQNQGIEVQILSGDSGAAVALAAQALDIESFYAACSAESKMQHVGSLQRKGACVMMAGDGVNDAPVIAVADVSIAMSGASDVTRAKADICLLGDRLSDIKTVRAYAARARRILRQNFFWALAYNISALPLAAMGLVPPLAAALGMSISSLLVVLNAARAAGAPGDAKDDARRSGVIRSGQQAVLHG